MNHAELLAGVTGIASDLGLLWHHCPDSRRCKGSRGLPDLIIAGPYGFVLAELKTGDADTTADQDLWGWTLARAWKAMGAVGRGGWVVWRPDDLDYGHVRRVLERIAG